MPRFYLQRWEVGGRLRVSEVDSGGAWEQSAAKAARETDFYSVAHESINSDEVPPLLFETVLGELEAIAAQGVGILIARGPEALTVEQRFQFALFLAFQITRGRTFRAEVHASLNERQRLRVSGWSDEAIRAHLAEAGAEVTDDLVAREREFVDQVQSGQAGWALPRGREVALSGQAALALGEHLFSRRWQVWTTPPILLTIDEPVVPVAGPGADRGERGGHALAGVVLFPLSPSRLLVMFHERVRPVGPPELNHVETAEVNRELLANVFRLAFDQPGRRTAERLKVPPAPPPLIVDLRSSEADGGGGRSDLYRTFKPTRWHQHDEAPPWPVARWWGGPATEHPPQLVRQVRQTPPRRVRPVRNSRRRRGNR